jgi:hypothetical protein
MKKAVRWVLLGVVGSLAAAFIFYRITVCVPEAYREGLAEGAPGDLAIQYSMEAWRRLNYNQQLAVLYCAGLIAAVYIMGRWFPPGG